jgi:uncharacterized repeat protein (TIGR03843 family)
MPRHERALETGLTDPRELSALESGELELLGLLPNSSNYTFLARARTSEGEVLAVYKPRRGETPLWDFPRGTLCQREVAAFVVARELGWPDIPPTLLRPGPEGPGSVQLFVEFDPTEHYFTLEGTRDDVFRRVAVFDLIVNNADRKGGHCLLAPDTTIWVVDHGVCFHEEPKLRTVIWRFVGEPIQPEVLADLTRLRQRLEPGTALRNELAELLSVRELEALGDRIQTVIDVGVFPEPGPGRPYPWPPV